MVVPNLIENAGAGTPGPPGSSVVPATRVVANSRGDYPLTEAGINDAIADINAAGGGTIYLGESGATNVAISATLTRITVPCKIIGAGRKATVLEPAANIVLFEVAEFSLTLSDFSIQGDQTTDQVFLELTAAQLEPSQRITIERLTIGNIIFSGNGRIKTVFDGGGFVRSILISDCIFGIADLGDLPGSELIVNGANVSLTMINTQALQAAAMPALGSLLAYNCFFASQGNNISVTTAELYNCSFSGFGFTVTFGTNAELVGCTFIMDDVTVGTDASVTNCNIVTGDLILAGDRCKVIGCRIASPVGIMTTGFGSHVIADNVFTGGGGFALEDSNNNSVHGNIECRVTESGTSDFNLYSDNTGFGASTITGAGSRVDAENYRNVRTYGAVGDGVTDDQAAIQAAINALPALGGVLFFPPGDYVLNSGLTFTVDTEVQGSGREATTIIPAAGVSVFSVPDVMFSVKSLSLYGDDNSAQKFIVCTAGSAQPQTHTINVQDVTIGNAAGVPSGRMKVAFDCATFTRFFYISDSIFNIRSSGDLANQRFILNGGNATFFLNNVQGYFGCEINACGTMYATNTVLFGLNTFNITVLRAASSSFNYTGTNGVLGAVDASSTQISMTGVTIGLNGSLSKLAACTVAAITAAWDDITITGSNITSFTSTTFGRHTLIGNSFPSGGAVNVTFTNSSNNLVKDCVNCRVTESGTSNTNLYTKIDTASTIVGASSRVLDAQDCSPEILVSNVASSTYATSTNRYIPLSKVAAPNEQYVQLQVRAQRAGRLRLVVTYAMSVTDAGDVIFAYSELQAAAGADPNGALSAASSTTFTPGAGVTFKTISISPSTVLATGDNYTFRITRDDGAGDTHPGSFNLVNMTALIW